MAGNPEYLELSALQSLIKRRVSDIEAWVRVEIDSHSTSGGHHYFGLLQKSPDGVELAKARGIIWRSNSLIIQQFESATGQRLQAGLSVVMYVAVNYDARFGLSLIIREIDAGYSIGQRELQKQESIRKLTESGLMELQKTTLGLPFLPSRIAVISSAEAAGYGDFNKHLSTNPYGYLYDLTLFQSFMQGDNAPSSIISNIMEIQRSGAYDVVLILRGGGAESDLFCFDDYELARTIAECPVPVLTAIGHERDFHIADMVAWEHFKTPTALADFLIEWVHEVELSWMETVENIRQALVERLVYSSEMEIKRSVDNIRFALNANINELDHKVALLEAGIKSSDPRNVLKQGYVLASDRKGNLLKSAKSGNAGDDFFLRFNDGLWNCAINDVKITKQ